MICALGIKSNHPMNDQNRISLYIINTAELRAVSIHGRSLWDALQNNIFIEYKKIMNKRNSSKNAKIMSCLASY